MPTPAQRRADADACPGALRLHAAADGPLARVRLPGGLLTGAQVRVLRTLAQRWGDGHVELTSRGNVQLRALTGAPTASLAAALTEAGLLPSRTHETVRNIAASPVPGVPDVRSLVRELDAELCADPRLADLPGRFLFALDTGALDVAASADAAVVPAAALDALSSATAAPPSPASVAASATRSTARGEPARPAQVAPAGLWAVVVGGSDVGLRVPADRVVAALLAVAHAFLDERDARQQPAWRVAELDNGPSRVAARAASLLRLPPPGPSATSAADADCTATGATVGPPRVGDPADAGCGGTPPGGIGTLPLRVREPVGVVPQPDGSVAVGATVPLGRLGGVPLEVLERAAHLVVTPWRGVLVPDLPPSAAASWPAALQDAGLAAHPGSRWAGVSACAGRPGCAKSLADVRSDADAATVPGDGLPVHWVGCARGCGSPAGPHVRVEATGPGYRVTAPQMSADVAVGEVGALVAAARRV